MAKSKVIVRDGVDYNFSDCLYKGCCQKCKQELEWTANFDADGTSYSANCCGKSYYMRPATVTASVSDEDEN